MTRSSPEADVAAARAGVTRAGGPEGLGGPDRPRGPRRPRRRTPGDGLHDFVSRWGWRAYAIPLLVVLTVVALMSSTTSTAAKNAPSGTSAAAGNSKAAVAPVVAPSEIQLKNDAPGANANNAIPHGYTLPAGVGYTKSGDGTYRVLPGTSPVVGSRGQLYRYSIDVENGIDDIDLDHFQQMVVQVLSDSRSWSGHGVRLERVDSGAIDFHVTLTSAMTVRTLCGYSIPVETSCYAPQDSVPGLSMNRVVLNDARWARGSTAYLGDLNLYRIYMINHEDGHALGHEHAHHCLPDGLAPVMMQQTFGLKSPVNKRSCEANPWPYPPGVRGTPGRESADTKHNSPYGQGD